MTPQPAVSRGDIWLVRLNPVRGHGQGGTRPALVVSADLLNRGPAGLAIVVPLTTRDRGINLHVPIEPPEGGLPRPSFAKCEDVRSISAECLVRPLGSVCRTTMEQVEHRLRILLCL